MVAMYLCRKSGASVTRIGQMFQRDHSTVSHCMPVIRKHFAEHPEDLAALQARLRMAAELHELDTLSGRVYLAVEKQVGWE
jgi:hypothetical protein